MIEPRERVAALKPYHLPDVKANIIMSANESPYNLPQEIVDQIKNALDRINYNRYPDPLSLELRGIIAEQYNEHNNKHKKHEKNGQGGVESLSFENVFVGNGGDEVILDLFLAYGGAGRKAITFDPMFEVYAITGFMTGTDMVSISRSTDDLTATRVLEKAYKVDASLIFLCCPNNPTGDLVPLEEIEKLLKNTEALVVIDEAYAEFCDQTAIPLLEKYDNLAILRTFSKAYSLAGLRAGYLLAGQEIIESLLKVKLFFNFNGISQAIVKIAIENKRILKEKVKAILVEREKVYSEMSRLNAIKVFPTEANFILFKTEKPGSEVWRGFLDRDILIRDCSNQMLLDNCLRVTVGTPEENDAFLKALGEVV
jgi:histidinol-phosphate aminotransferase